MSTAILIPTDPRTGKPLVTSEMKAVCIGEFHVTVAHTCISCYGHAEESYDMRGNSECPDCHGNVTFECQHEIPWGTMKDIYKMMAAVAAAGLTPSVRPPVFDVGFETPSGGDQAALSLVHRNQMATFTIIPAKEQPETRPITFQGGSGIEYCPVCPFSTSLMELEQEDGYQRLKCPKCGHTRSL